MNTPDLINENHLLLLGALLFAVLIWFLKWFIQRTLNSQFDKLNTSRLEDRKEREHDQYLALRGQQVTNDCLHELIYAVINGTHNGGLQKANDELEAYRSLVDDNLAEKAARWTEKISK